MCAYAPGIQDIRGQLLGQGIQQAGQNIASGYTEYRANQQKDQSARGIVTGILSQNPDLVKNAGEDTQKLLEKFKTGNTGLDDNVYLAGLMATAAKQKGEAQQQQMQQLQIAASQRQQQEAARQDAMRTQLTQMGSGVGNGVYAPQAQGAMASNPFLRAQAQVLQAGGQMASPESLLAYKTQQDQLNQKTEVPQPKFITAPGGQQMVQLGNSITKLDKPDVLPGSQGYEVIDQGALGKIIKDKATGKPLSASDIQAMPKTEKPSEAETAFRTNLSVGKQKIDELRKVIGKSGTWETRFGDADSAAKLNSLPYSLAILTAKIVDPSSVAREGEVAAAQKYMVPLGMTSSKEVAMKALDELEKTYNQYESGRDTAEGKGPSSAVTSILSKYGIK